MAELYKSLGEYHAAAIAYEAGVQALRRMIERGMKVEQSKRELATVEQARAEVEQMNIALEPWEDILNRPVETLPDLLILRGIEMISREQMRDAVQAVDRLRECEDLKSGHLYNATCVYCLCAVSIKPDADELTPEQTMQKQELITNALATLQKAIAAGWKDFDHMQKDPDLTPLRDLPEFRELMTDGGSRQK